MPHAPVEPRKRPRQSRANATVEAILEAAARLLEVHGLLALNTNRVAEAAGVSIGSLYQYFPAKEALLVELVRRNRQTLLHTVEAAIAKGKDLDSTFDLLIEAAIKHQFERPSLAHALEYADSITPLDKEDQTLRDALTEALSTMLMQYGVTHAETVALDLLVIVRSLIDAAALRGEREPARLTQRVRYAVMGYLKASQT